MGSEALKLEEKLVSFPEVKPQKLGLVWDKERELEKVVIDCKEKFPILKEISSKAIISDESSPTNLIIEGDNYHALSVLNYTHKGKIDLIYIDPPYNLGNGDFIYNDQFVDKNDSYRHSKWLQFMEKRLRLAKNLLSQEGSIFVSIDDNEYPRLVLLMEDIFGENTIKTICVKMSESSGVKMSSVNEQGTIPKLKEYIVIAKKNGVVGIHINKIPKDAWDEEYNTIITNTSKREINKIKNIQHDTNRTNEEIEYFNQTISLWTTISLSKYLEIYNQNKNIDDKKFRQENAYRIVRTAAMSGKSNEIAIKKNRILSNQNFFSIITPKKKICIIKPFKTTSKKPRSEVLFASDHLGFHPGDLWMDIKTTGIDSEGGVSFKNGKKPLSLIKRIINTNIKKSITVLDFFSGSGTTGEAVLSINKEDGGDRKFILCTNNESEICTKKTYPRVRNAIEGYKNREPLGGNVRYFKTNFIPYRDRASDSVKAKLMENATEMICIKEDAFEPVGNKKRKSFKIFKGRNIYLGILFDEASLNAFREEVKKINRNTAIYVFALFGLGQYENKFTILKNVQIVPVPEAIMEVYKRLFYGIKT